MTRYLVDAVMILGLTWFGTQAFRFHRNPVTSANIEKIQQAEFAH